MHKKLLDYRNTLLAHNDISPHREAAREVLVFPSGGVLREAFTTEERARVDMDGIAAARDLAEFQKERMKTKADDLVAELQSIHGWDPDQVIRL